jgi:putative ABC transport system permease protein
MFARWQSAWRAMRHRGDFEFEMTDELKFHIEKRADDLRRAGASPEEAMRRAKMEFGATAKHEDDCREARKISFFDDLRKDLRFGLRALVKSPGFTAVAVLTLALGFGATTSIFSVVNAILFHPLPYYQESRVMLLRETDARRNGNDTISVPYPDFLDWREQSRAFSKLAVVHNLNFAVTGIGEPEQVDGFAVSPNFLSLLGVKPALGRDFSPDEEKQGTAPVVMLSYAYWQSHYGGDQSVVGRTILLYGRPYTIVGVLPQNFYYTSRAAIWAPIGIWVQFYSERGSHDDTDVIGRLADGVTLPQAQSEMSGIASRLAKQYPATNTDESVSIKPIRDEFTGDAKSAVLILFGAVTFVLLIACVNVANLSLVRGVSRSKEIALRIAIGASRGRLVRQMLTESLLLSAIGGLLGIAVGAWSLRGLTQLIGGDAMMAIPIHMDGAVVAFAVGMIFVVALLFGMIPAFHALRPEVRSSLQESGRSSTAGARQNRLRAILVVAETALALVLLAGAGLMMKSLYLLLHVNGGFEPNQAYSMFLNLGSTRYKTEESQRSFWREVVPRLQALPGVESVALGTNVPLTDDHYRADITLLDRPTPGPSQFPHPDTHSVSPDYFRTLKIPLLRGRTFTEMDNASAPLVGVINETAANRFWPAGNAIGQRFIFGHPSPDHKAVTIVGVVADTRLYGFGQPARLEVYRPIEQEATQHAAVVIRSQLDGATLAPEIRRTVSSIDKDEPVVGFTSMNQLLYDWESTRRETLLLLEIFSGLALVLATIGIFGVVSYNVAQRTNEIGIRVAMGAQQRDVLRMVLGHGAKLAATGVGIGLVAALALTQLLAGLLYGVKASDPSTHAVVALLLIAVALIACYIPARRAMRVDPMIALRHE